MTDQIQTIDTFEPQSLWQSFALLCATPRPSGHEAQVMSKIMQWAKQHQLSYQQDAVGNLLIKAPASAGFEHCPVITLQGHVDMVAQADIPHDFLHDPIEAYVDQGWVRARGTTLGADNGIGVAAAMALLIDQQLTHGPLEVLLTISEETSMLGAAQIANNWLAGIYVLNLDSEGSNEVTIGCAGGMQINIDESWPMIDLAASNIIFEISIDGLQGGHSGIDINKSLASANRLLPRLLLNLLEDEPELQLISYIGGTMNNAITRQASAVFSVPKNKQITLNEKFNQIKQTIEQEWLRSEAQLKITLHPTTEKLDKALSVADSLRFVRLLVSLPYGVERMSDEVVGVVETSNNIGIVHLADEHIKIELMARSLRNSAALSLIQRIESLCCLAGLHPQRKNYYPSWQPRIDSPLLTRFKEIHESIEPHVLKVQVVHAGLECGLLSEKYPQAQFLSFGPNIEGAHSPSERVNIASVIRFWQLLRTLVTSLAINPLKI